ncbi:hypothetical protein KKB41_02260 [Patescibacteria group bacterium]|nr:hypothetical protein [Patescibacteria group bacterium]
MNDIEMWQNWAWLLMLIALWTLPWKGVALWRAAKASQKAWFVILLIFNTLGILEILYIFLFSKKKKKEEDKQEIFHTTLKF